MPPSRRIRRIAPSLLLAACAAATAGCGGTPADGTQVDVTIPKEEAVKQNQAMQDFAKNRPKPVRPGQSNQSQQGQQRRSGR